MPSIGPYIDPLPQSYEKRLEEGRLPKTAYGMRMTALRCQHALHFGSHLSNFYYYGTTDDLRSSYWDQGLTIWNHQTKTFKLTERGKERLRSTKLKYMNVL